MEGEDVFVFSLRNIEKKEKFVCRCRQTIIFLASGSAVKLIKQMPAAAHFRQKPHYCQRLEHTAANALIVWLGGRTNERRFNSIFQFGLSSKQIMRELSVEKERV